MMKHLSIKSAIAFGVLPWFMTPIAMASTLPGPLVDTAWLSGHLADVQVIEVRDDARSYYSDPEIEVDAKTGNKELIGVGGHIDGAALLDFKTVRVERTLDGKKVKFLAPEADAFQAQMRSAGVRSRPIVIVPQGQSIEDVDQAARLYWTFRLNGEDNVALLDGGMAAWIMGNNPISKANQPVVNGDWTAKAQRSDILATSDDTAKASAAGAPQLVDARPAGQFYGVVKSPAVQAFGHVDGAKDLPPDVLGRKVNGAFRFLPAKSYAGVLAAAGIKPDQETISYCNTGHLASGAWFALTQLAGMKNVKLYDGSLALWTQEHRPLVNPAAQ